ncbi:MAG: exo-alpha-sialidase [Planctomycetes bacterium]|nr:exo-alpha-sialidase [Planctomycetota bacterium]
MLGAACASPAAAGIEVRRVLGPESPGGKYKHPASVTQLENGDLFLVFHGGTGEYEDDTAVWGTRLVAGEAAWEAPRIVADTPFHGDGNAVVWQAPGGAVWLFYVVRYGPTWASSRIQARVSRDGTRTWSDPFVLAFDAGRMVRNRPIVLEDGDYLLPIYHEVGTDPEVVSADCTSLFLRHHAKERRWSETSPIRSRLGNIQPAVVQLTQDHLICYCRRGGDYGGRRDGFLVRSESHDGGRTWAPGADSRFPNPNAAVDLLELRNGHLLLVYNDSFSDRTPLTAAISTDGDKTYPHRRNIAEGPGDFAYPYALEARDGKIHVVFTSDERTVIRMAVFEESAVLRGRA